MNIAYSSVVKETITENGATRERLVTVVENHVREHGTSPPLKQLFDAAREASSSDHDREVISWLESAISKEHRRSHDSSSSHGLGRIGRHLEQKLKLHDHGSESESESDQDGDKEQGRRHKGHIFVSPVFFPSEESFGHLISTLDGAKKSLDICVFTITDDQISRAIIRAHERGLRVRIVSDDAKSEDLGSDVKRLAKENGIPTRVDGSVSHMHHKFVIIDDALVITGSYNWTKGARFDNREDLTLTNSGRAVRAFQAEFDKLWEEFESYEL
ncbi:hypothetical protein BG011_003341 [Mortierella polycephala]|uniref:Mitochondrial cardiolipin hydrolase n=1 Tax=Mortierella polycephala TaxID=41804 RepID=A0A9P6Q594_9FUNG|nr:hypothetical protein BG011_003341 [Mortierella polycephala]